MTFRREVLAEGVECILGDCLEVLPHLSRMGVVVSDPPYGIAYQAPGGKTPGSVGRAARGNYAMVIGDDRPFDPTPWLEWQQVCLFGANNFADKLPPSAKWLVWDKRAGMTPNDNSDCELAWCKAGGSSRLITHLWNGMLKASEREDKRVHPAQKPVAVMEWAIEQVAGPGTPVLDPYMGSGSTGVACVRQRREFTGIEIDPGYFDIACRRIEAALKQPDFFVDPPKPLKQTALFDGDAA